MLFSSVPLAVAGERQMPVTRRGRAPFYSTLRFAGGAEFGSEARGPQARLGNLFMCAGRKRAALTSIRLEIKSTGDPRNRCELPGWPRLLLLPGDDLAPETARAARYRYRCGAGLDCCRRTLAHGMELSRLYPRPAVLASAVPGTALENAVTIRLRSAGAGRSLMTVRCAIRRARSTKLRPLGMNQEEWWAL